MPFAEKGSGHMERLSSKENALIKQYRKLSASRREREKESLFTMEGARLCADALRSGIRLHLLLMTADAARYEETAALAEAAGKRAFEITPELAGYISDTEHPQGIFAIAEMPPRESDLPPQGKYILLDSLQDPGNLGTVIRTAEAMGIDAVILSRQCPDLYSPKVIRSTMGSLFRQPILYAENLSESIAEWKNAGMKCYAATLTPDAFPLQKLPQMPFCGIVIGNEGNGVSREVIEACDGEVYIPMQGATESLNAAIAAALCMWEISGKYIPLD